MGSRLMADLLKRLKAALAHRYTIERLLGSGGMATVYLAHDLKHDRKVALKIMRPELSAILGGERFLREIRIAAKLNHPHILALYDSGEVDGHLYYVMPHVGGESLRSKIEREKQLPIDEAIVLTRQVASALDYAHEQGVIHRDIKPENILLHRGEAVVADFGIALAVTAAGGERLTETGLSLGTPEYMSPEQATGSGDVDARSDVYSLGAVLYEMVTGEPPLTGATVQALIAKLLTERPTQPRVVRDSIPEVMNWAIMKALAKVPADRYATAEQFTQALTSQEVVAPVGEQFGRLRGRRAAVYVALGLLVIVVAYLALKSGRSTRAGSEPVRASYAQLTAEPGIEWFPSLSPDGRWLVYSAGGSGNRDIYLKSVGGQNPINLTPDSPADDDQPAFSSDGEQIAFWSSRDGGGIFIMGRTGEAVRRVTRSGFRPTWSPDGQQLAYATENVVVNPQNTEGLSQLWVVDVNRDERRRLDVVDGVLPNWSPHGHRIAFMRRQDQTGAFQADVCTVRVAGGEPTAVTNDVATDWSPVWSPDGRYLYFSSDRAGSMSLWRVAIDEESGETLGPPEPIAASATSLAHMSVSGDGRSIAYSSILVTQNIQRQSIDPAIAMPIGQPRWVTTGSRRWSSPDPSPDGEQVVFYSLTQPEGHVYVAGNDGTGLRRVTGDTAIDRVPRWSPDGDWIAFSSTRGGQLDVWKIRPDGSDLTQLTMGGVAFSVWSPNGSRMAGSSVQEDLRTMFVFDPNESWDEQVPQALSPLDESFADFTVNSWSPDGERVAGEPSFSDEGIIVYTFRTGTYARLTDFGQWPVWFPDSRRLLFVSGGKQFYVVDIETREVRTVLSVARDVIGLPGLSRDGREMYYSRRVTESDIWLLTLAGTADDGETER
jgi:Tol biopolymer transport system component/tRNA A-37 threonylcarbamoyl transferase component Bud32